MRFVVFLLGLVLAGSLRAGISFVPGHYYTAGMVSGSGVYGSGAITEWDESGAKVGVLTLPTDVATDLRGLAFGPDGLLYTVAGTNPRNYRVIAITSQGAVMQAYPVISSYVGGDTSSGKIAVGNGYIYVSAFNDLTRYQVGAPSSSGASVFTGNGIIDAKVLSSGNLLVASQSTITEITADGARVRQFAPSGGGTSGFVFFSDIRGVEYHAPTNKLFVTHLGYSNFSFRIMRFDYASGILETNITYGYADDMFMDAAGNLAVGSSSQPPVILNRDLGVLRTLGTESRAFVTQYSGPSISAPARVPGARGEAFTFQVQADNSPTSFGATGLPPGLMINASTGLITGTPTTAGLFNVVLTATGATSSLSREVIFAISPLAPEITSAATTSGVASTAFSFQVVVINNPVIIDASGLPPGLSINRDTGLITGFPRRAGIYSVTVSAANQTGATNQTLQITIQPQDKILVNVSTRMRVQGGDNILIGGFVIDGPISKKVIVRAVSPSLTAAGFDASRLIADPTLELRDSTGALVAENDDWQTQTSTGSGTATEISASGYAPRSTKEPAVLRTLAPGAYTVLVRGKNASGIGLVEVYDLEPDSSRLVNISTRGRVETGDDVMIGGFVASGTSPTRVLIRSVGPSLVAAGFAPADLLADPVLEIRNSSGAVVALSDNWREGDAAAVSATGLAPTDDREPAVVLTLAPGAYTAIVRGKNNTSGLALVEVYRLP